ncbi:glycosyltransferase [Pelagibacterium sp. 26DY04]|uniref:CgeB family protein n=1 Tax=Pelagibacterium sp. 26DY04 TaxID=2967130 RepID=UPI0028162AC2|nr:glycosyltransferase [Pelagibacterium sp. 26DY04]WMT86140.1 glycosyltransferase [Pelagibacterium sp. 26DY04]
MRFVFYTHSLVSDWNHGNAHFLRGLMRVLTSKGCSCLALEPEDSWSRTNLEKAHGRGYAARFGQAFPTLSSQQYGAGFDHRAALDGADVVMVHEWTDPELIAEIGRIRKEGGTFTLLFHDTHHRAVSAERQIADLMLENYDGILAFGETLRQRYLDAGRGRQVFTFHEAADVDLFHPLPLIERQRDLVWIGNWGDGERTAELEEFLIAPARELGLTGTVHGVRYPDRAIDLLAQAGLDYQGWLPNAEVPRVFANHRFTVHVPRRPYVQALPGIPTIRVFEALACGIPLISAPWRDEENLFRPGEDFLFARNGEEVRAHMRDLLADPERGRALAQCGLETIRNRHTCAHRVDQLFDIVRQLDGNGAATRGAA